MYAIDVNLEAEGEEAESLIKMLLKPEQGLDQLYVWECWRRES